MRFILLSVSLMFLVGCSTPIKLSGEYNGTMPCASCEGIKSSLKLDNAGVYHLDTTYLDGSDTMYRTSGIWFVNQDEKMLHLVDDDMHYYVIEDDTLELLDKEGNRVELGEHYQITRDCF